MAFAIVFLLVFARVAALVLTAPILGSNAVPIRFRIGAAIVLSLIALPLVPAGSLPSIEPAGLVAAALAEVMIGSALGLGVTLIFSAAQMAGAVIGQMAGIQLSDQLDPTTGQAGTPISQLFGVLSLATFALMGGPELVISALLGTFASLPIGLGIGNGGIERTELATLMTQVLRQSFLLTLRGVGPAVVALMISTVTISMVARSYPQMNLSGIGLSSNIVVMMLSVFLVSGGCMWLFVDDLTGMIELIQTTLQTSQVAH